MRPLSLAVVALAAVLFSDDVAANQSAPRPNIVIVLVDDMGFSDVGCYGGEIDTPNIDHLASRGVRFTQFYNSGRCCPTRASLMTGLQPHQVGIGHMTEPPERTLGFEGAYQGYLNDNCVTIAQVLRKAGYHTLMTGKWHLGMHRRETWPLQRGFDRFYGCLSGGCNYFKPGGGRGITLDNDPVETDESFYTTDTFTDYACKFVTDAVRTDDRPFFLYLAYNAPHWPLNSKWGEFLKYKGKYRDGWHVLMKRRLAKQKAMGLVDEDTVPAPHVGPKWDSLSEKQREDLDSIMAAYAGCIDSIDQNIGKLTRHLERLGELENTVIFFLSDNGACQEGGVLGKGSLEMVRNPPLETVAGVRLGLAWANACNTPFRLYKHFVHEGGACTPMIASWPAGIPRRLEGSFVRRFAYLPDFMATCLELAGAEYPEGVPPHVGASMLPLLKGSQDPIHVDPIYFEHEGNAALRWGRWKLVREYKKPWELFDINADRAEMNDLANTESAKRDELVTLWTDWARKTRVAFPERFNMYDFLREQRKREKAVHGDGKRVAKRPHLKIRGIYGGVPSELLEGGKTLKDYGVNAIWMGSGSVDAEKVVFLKSLGARVFAEFNTLHVAGYLKDHPDAAPVGVDGERSRAPHGWQGICPTHRAYREYRMNEFRKVLGYAIDGIWLDYHHAHSSWERAEPALPDTCFCQRCLTQFERGTDTDLPEAPTSELSALLLGKHKEAWVKWRCGVFTDWVREFREIIESTRPEALLGTFHCPWKDTERDGALRNKLAIDLKAQAKYVDVFSIMPYHARFGHATDPAWISRQTKWLGRHLGVEGKPDERLKIWPIVQISDWGEPVPLEQVAEALDHGTRRPATGVMVFHWGALRKHREKCEEMGKFYRAITRDGAGSPEVAPERRQ